MRSLTETLLLAVAFLAAAALLLFGVRQLPIRRARPGWRREFLFALAAAFAAISPSAAQDPPAEKQEDKDARAFDERVKEVEKDSRWRQMRKTLRKLIRQLKGDDPLDEKLRTEKHPYPVSRKEAQKPGDPLLTPDEAIEECSRFVALAAYHLWRTRGGGAQATCYSRGIMSGNPHLPEQLELLKRQLDEGKISKEVYDRLVITFNMVGRLLPIFKGLNARNTALAFRLIRDMAGKRAIELPKLSPELEKQIADLIQQLGGAEELEKRSAAQDALLQIGDPAIPQLREALKNPDVEISSRAKAILDEVE